MNISEEILKLKDEKYKEFHSKLIPTINPDLIIGVRMPEIKKLAKKLLKRNEGNAFIKALPHKYYDENTLHAVMISEINDFDICIKAVDEFLPFVDNWATCDSLRPKCFKGNAEKLFLYIKKWITSEYPFAVRFAIEMLMIHYLENSFKRKYMQMVSKVKSDEYYVNMMVSWYFATALAFQYDSAIAYIENGVLPIFVHNKTIRKAIESYRISSDKKAYLKSLKKRG